MAMKNMFCTVLTCIFIIASTCECANKKSKRIVKSKLVHGKETTSDNDTNVLLDIPIVKLEQTILDVQKQGNAYAQKFDYAVQYTKYKFQLTQNYDKVIQLQSKLVEMNQSFTTIFTTDPVMIQLQNEKWCIQAVTNAIKTCRPVYLHEYGIQYQNIVTQLKNMHDSFNQAHPAKKFSVSVFGKQVEFRKNLNYSTVHQWINNTLETLKYTNAWNQSIQLMFDNGTLVNNYNELALFGIKLQGMLEKNANVLQQINNRIQSKISASSSKYQNTKNQLQTAIQQYNQTYQLFFDKIKYMLVHRQSRAMQLSSHRQQIRTVMLKLECTAFAYSMIRLFDPNIHRVSHIAHLFRSNVFLNGTHHTLKSPAFTMLNQTFNDNVLNKVASVNPRTNIQLWRKEVLKSIEHKTKVLLQELFSDENCKVLNEIIAEGIDFSFMYLVENLPFLLESARNRQEEYLSTKFERNIFDMFSNKDVCLLPAISISIIHLQNNTTNIKYLMVNIRGQYQDLQNGRSYKHMIDVRQKLSDEIDKNIRMKIDKIMAYLKSVNLHKGALQVNDTSFQQQTDMIHWLFADNYGVNEIYNLAAIKAILSYHHDEFELADIAASATNSVFSMTDSEIMGVWCLVQQQLMVHEQQVLYLSTLEIAQKWYDMLNSEWNQQKDNITDYMTSLEARLVALDI